MEIKNAHEMKTYFKQTRSALMLVLRDQNYLALAITLATILFALFIGAQVLFIPANTLRFQFGLLRGQDLALLGAISAINALFISLQVYEYRLQRQARQAISATALSGFGTLSGFSASVFGTATCGLCVSAFFGFLGANSTLFLISHRTSITLAMLGVLCIAIVISSQRLYTTCERCRIPLELEI